MVCIYYARKKFLLFFAIPSVLDPIEYQDSRKNKNFFYAILLVMAGSHWAYTYPSLREKLEVVIIVIEVHAHAL